MNPPPSRLATDVTWLALLAATALAGVVFDGTVSIGPVAAVLMVVAVLKSALILAVFMDLARTSLVVLVGLVAFMAMVGTAVAVLV